MRLRRLGFACGGLLVHAAGTTHPTWVPAGVGILGLMVVPLREYVFVIVGSVALSLILLAALWPWARQLRALVTIALTTAVGIVIWNTALNVTNATWLNVDSRVFGLSAQDVGSGVGALLVTLVVLRFFTNKADPAGRILAASGLVGLVTCLVDLFG